MRAASLGSCDPLTAHPGRVMAHVLAVAAFEIGDPIAVLVGMKIHYAP